MPADPDDLLALCTAIQDEAWEDELTTWEAEFVEAMADALADGARLSDRQIEKLREIYGKVFVDA